MFLKGTKMKRFILSLIISVITSGIVFAASPTPDYIVRTAIIKYKRGNYTGCIQDLETYVKKRPTALAYYYLGMAYTQATKQDEAIESYNKAIEYATKENNNYLKSYAQLGKKKTEQSEKFAPSQSYEEIDNLIKSPKSLPEDLKADLRKKHLEYLRNEINSGKTPKAYY